MALDANMYSHPSLISYWHQWSIIIASVWVYFNKCDSQSVHIYVYACFQFLQSVADFSPLHVYLNGGQCGHMWLFQSCKLMNDSRNNTECIGSVATFHMSCLQKEKVFRAPVISGLGDSYSLQQRKTGGYWAGREYVCLYPGDGERKGRSHSRVREWEREWLEKRKKERYYLFWRNGANQGNT